MLRLLRDQILTKTDISTSLKVFQTSKMADYNIILIDKASHATDSSINSLERLPVGLPHLQFSRQIVLAISSHLGFINNDSQLTSSTSKAMGWFRKHGQLVAWRGRHYDRPASCLRYAIASRLKNTKCTLQRKNNT